MKLLPWDYGVRNLLRRPVRTGLTALGLMLVVFLLLLVVSFLQGLNNSLEQSGDPDVIILHNLAAAENLDNSSIWDQVPGLARVDLEEYLAQTGGTVAMSPELAVTTLVQLKDHDGPPTLASLRGVDWQTVSLVRRMVHLTEGRIPIGRELIIGRLASAKLGLPDELLSVGNSILIEGKAWKIVGRFAAPGSLYEAEMWGPLDELKIQMKRPNDISLLALRLDATGNRNLQMGYIEKFCSDQNLSRGLELMSSREVDYYAFLQRHYGPLQALVWLLVILVGGAGACGAVNTMYAAVAGRKREFAALQAVGFSRRSIALSLVQESVLLAALATLIATGLGFMLIQGVAVRFTMGAFALQLDQMALLMGCGVGLGLGIVGALPPALRAFRTPIAEGLKAV